MDRRRMKAAAMKQKRETNMKARLVGYLKNGTSLGSAALMCGLSIHEAAAIISK